MLWFVIDLIIRYLKTKNICKNAVKELSFLINGGMLKLVPDCYKNQQICNKANDNLAYAFEFVPGCQNVWWSC